MSEETNKIKVKSFWLQETRSFPDNAPQREEYDTDEAFEKDCKIYAREWREEYECCNENCRDRNCPQHFP